MRVGILPYDLRYEYDLAKVPVNSLTWPGQDVPDLETLADLDSNDHVVVYPSSKRLLRGFGKIRCKVDLMLAEPFAIHKRYYQSIWLLRHKFNAIYCRYGYYARRYANVVQFSVVDSWVDGGAIDLDYAKTKACSLIASGKQNLQGHKIRHEMVVWVREQGAQVDVLGRGYQPFEHKQDGLLPYHYSVVIENVQEVDYFTEKLLDCMLCGTLPIYWGAPNISDYFDVEGMVVCENASDIELAIANNSQKPSALQAEAMERNRIIAISLSQLQPRIVAAIQNKEVT